MPELVFNWLKLVIVCQLVSQPGKAGLRWFKTFYNQQTKLRQAKTTTTVSKFKLVLFICRNVTLITEN